MIAYKKLIYDEEAPLYPLVISPVHGDPWILKDGLMYLSVPPESVTPRSATGIYSAKSWRDKRLETYFGDVMELQIGGVVIEGDYGYRSSEAAVTRQVHAGWRGGEGVVLADTLVSYSDKLPDEHIEYIVYLLYRYKRYFSLDTVIMMCRNHERRVIINKMIKQNPQYEELKHWRNELSNMRKRIQKHGYR